MHIKEEKRGRRKAYHPRVREARKPGVRGASTGKSSDDKNLEKESKERAQGHQ